MGYWVNVVGKIFREDLDDHHSSSDGEVSEDRASDYKRHPFPSQPSSPDRRPRIFQHRQQVGLRALGRPDSLGYLRQSTDACDDPSFLTTRYLGPSRLRQTDRERLRE